MIGSELKTFVESLIDDTIEETLFYSLLNIAKDRLEDEIEWEILKTWDKSVAWNPGDSYLTEKNLPSNFRSMYADGVIYLGEDNPYFSVPYKDIYKYRNSANKYSIDYKNNKLHIIGAEAISCSIYIPYLETTADITETTEWSFPSRFHKILGLRVAAYYTSGVDADDLYARMSPAHRLAAQELENGLKKWNTRLALMAMDNSSAPFIQNGYNPNGRLSSEDLN